MADQDFLSYSSIYNTFSKGPKSIYYGIGDEMLPGFIFNVPQDDDDDEWGRTDRIASERTADFIARIYKTLFDPYNSIPGISLVPGEAGSEINVAKNMIRLIGRTGIDTGVFDLSVPSLTLEDVTIDGSDSTISIGTSGFEISENTISIPSITGPVSNGPFKITTASPWDPGKEGIMSFGRADFFLYDDLTDCLAGFYINGSLYTFSENTIWLPDVDMTINGFGTLTIFGPMITQDVYPTTGGSYNLGTASFTYKNIYADKLILGTEHPAISIDGNFNFEVNHLVSGDATIYYKRNKILMYDNNSDQYLIEMIIDGTPHSFDSKYFKSYSILTNDIAANPDDPLVGGTLNIGKNLGGGSYPDTINLRGTAINMSYDASNTVLALGYELLTIGGHLFPKTSFNPNIGWSGGRFGTIVAKYADFSNDIVAANATVNRLTVGHIYAPSQQLLYGNSSVIEDTHKIYGRVSMYSHSTSKPSIDVRDEYIGLNKSIIPETTGIDLGDSGNKFDDIYGNYFVGQNFGTHLNPVTFCGGSYVRLKNHEENWSLTLRNYALEPSPSAYWCGGGIGNLLGTSLGTSTKLFSYLYLADTYDGAAMRVRVTSGVLHVDAV